MENSNKTNNGINIKENKSTRNDSMVNINKGKRNKIIAIIIFIILLIVTIASIKGKFINQSSIKESSAESKNSHKSSLNNTKNSSEDSDLVADDLIIESDEEGTLP